MIQQSPTEERADARYLIRKGGAYYRPNAAGYTRCKHEAGRYTLAEAISHSHPNGPDGPRDGIDYVPAGDAAVAQPAEADGVDLTGLRGVDKLARLMVWHHFGIRWEHLEKVSQQEITAACQAAFDWMNRPLPERQASLDATPKAPTSTDALPAGAPGLDVDGMCNDHGVFGCKRCLATPPAPNDDLRAALEARDVRVSECPDTKLDPNKDCPRCGASSNEGCRITALADAGFVHAARTALKENRRADTVSVTQEPRGTSVCPICGKDTPHHHTAPVVNAYQNKRSRK